MSNEEVKVKVISRERFAQLLLNFEISFEERKEMVEKEFEIAVPEDIVDGEPFLEFVYSSYIELLEEYSIMVKTKTQKKNKVGGRKGVKKEWILDWIKENKEFTRKDLEVALDEEFKYSETGRSPRARVRNVLKECERKGIIIRSPKVENLYEYVGEHNG